MADQYRISESNPPEPEERDRPAAGGTDALLWAVLIGGALLNAGFSLLGPELLAVPFGVAATAAGIALAVRHFRRRR